MVVNVVYAFFDTFAIIDSVTQGGPFKATETLVYKVYNDGFVNRRAVGYPDPWLRRVLAERPGQFRIPERGTGASSAGAW